MKKLFFILFLGSIISCEQKVSQSQQKSIDTTASLFYGNWLIHEYFDSIGSNNERSLSASEFGITELVFSPAFKDSVLFINEDMETSMEKIEIIAKDTILLSLTDAPYNLITYNETTGNLTHQIDERYPIYHFYKAPDSLIENNTYPTAFRKSLNSFFSKNTFKEIQNHKENANTIHVVFDLTGKVNGLLNYKTYKIVVNGDLDNIKNATRIDFSDGQKTEGYGLKLTDNGFDLYTIKLLTEPGEKPYYKTDQLFKSFVKGK